MSNEEPEIFYPVTKHRHKKQTTTNLAQNENHSHEPLKKEEDSPPPLMRLDAKSVETTKMAIKLLSKRVMNEHQFVSSHHRLTIAWMERAEKTIDDVMDELDDLKDLVGKHKIDGWLGDESMSTYIVQPIAHVEKYCKNARASYRRVLQEGQMEDLPQPVKIKSVWRRWMSLGFKYAILFLTLIIWTSVMNRAHGSDFIMWIVDLCMLCIGVFTVNVVCWI